MLNYLPATDLELMSEKLLPEGIYPFEIISAREKTSRPKDGGSGKPMLEIEMKVFKQNGSFHFVKDWLMLSGAFRFKFKHCAEACGLSHEYENNLLDEKTFEGKQGYLKIFIRVPEDGSLPRNSVKDYIKKENAPVHKNDLAQYEMYAAEENERRGNGKDDDLGFDDNFFKDVNFYKAV